MSFLSSLWRSGLLGKSQWPSSSCFSQQPLLCQYPGFHYGYTKTVFLQGSVCTKPNHLKCSRKFWQMKASWKTSLIKIFSPYKISNLLRVNNWLNQILLKIVTCSPPRCSILIKKIFIGLCVTTMLTICNFWGSVNRQLPQVNYAKAVDYYFIVSFLFILLTLVEYTIVLNSNFEDWKKKSEDKSSRKHSLKRENSLKGHLPVSWSSFIFGKISYGLICFGIYFPQYLSDAI